MWGGREVLFYVHESQKHNTIKNSISLVLNWKKNIYANSYYLLSMAVQDSCWLEKFSLVSISTQMRRKEGDGGGASHSKSSNCTSNFPPNHSTLPSSYEIIFQKCFHFWGWMISTFIFFSTIVFLATWVGEGKDLSKMQLPNLHCFWVNIKYLCLKVLETSDL